VAVDVARFNFLDPRARGFYPDWDGAADVSVAIVRTEAGRNPYDESLQESASDDNLGMLASWAVTTQTIGSARPADQEEPTHGA
jgi:hypothetical protein